MQKTMHKITISKDFSDTPGPRSRTEGDFSGEDFLEKLLLPAYKQALAEGSDLVVDLDGTEGYATSFLEAAFGGLARIYEPKEILTRIKLKSDDEPYLVEEIKNYILDARK